MRIQIYSLDCHNANVTATNIETQFAKTYIHNIYGYNGTHDPTEPNTVLTMHVECIDCHNPHASNNTAASAPNANGFLAGVKGIDQSGNPVDPVLYEYEVCYRCHADNPATPSPSTRVYGTNNVRLDFATTNTAYHPVAGARSNPDVPSLIAPLTQASIIYCTDCHASDGVGSPAGPHGSIYPQILNEYYNRADNTGLVSADVTTLNANFPLCAQCHNMITVRSSHLGMKNAHILIKTSCNTCHDPHGFTGGNLLNNNFLINFNTDVIFPNGNGNMSILINGGNSGVCNMRCHGHNHVADSY